MRYKLTVRPSYIRAQGRHEPCGCPVARAFLAAGFNFDEENYGVDGKTVEAIDPYGFKILRTLPKKVKKWIDEFDNEEVSIAELKRRGPFTFTINA